MYKRMYRAFRRLAVAGALLFLAVTFLPGLLEGWTALLQSRWSTARGGTLIVLGGDLIAPGVLGPTSYWRCIYAVWEWREGGFERIVVSGGGGLAEAMRDYLVGQGIPVSAIVLENRSRNTGENARFTVDLLRGQAGTKVMLTSDYHSRRAWLAFRKCGLEVEPRPVPDAGKRVNSPAMRWSVFQDLVIETVKYAGYTVQGRL
jgi:uncharacterized SAM-binding protein YcdF (DUF218 family)